MYVLGAKYLRNGSTYADSEEAVIGGGDNRRLSSCCCNEREKGRDFYVSYKCFSI